MPLPALTWVLTFIELILLSFDIFRSVISIPRRIIAGNSLAVGSHWILNVCWTCLNMGLDFHQAYLLS